MRSVNLRSAYIKRDALAQPTSSPRKERMRDFLEVRELRKEFSQADIVAIESVSFTVDQGDFLSIVGPSGCGKTTLLRAIGGLTQPTSGEVTLKGRKVTGPPEGAVVVFQDYSKSLLPWRTVLGNVTLGLETLDTLSAHERVQRARRYLEAVNVPSFEKFYPRQLSGGMQQRVAIARALAFQPEILLMDEPFASVDAQTRGDLEDLVRRIWKEFDQTILLVTHDIEEAIYLATKVVVIGARPSRVIDYFSVDLGTERDQLATREDHRFLELRHRVYDAIRIRK
jgi:NitT/TauT family transport system ATP-binding protein